MSGGGIGEPAAAGAGAAAGAAGEPPRTQPAAVLSGAFAGRQGGRLLVHRAARTLAGCIPIRAG